MPKHLRLYAHCEQPARHARKRQDLIWLKRREWTDWRFQRVRECRLLIGEHSPVAHRPVSDQRAEFLRKNRR